MSDRKSEAEIPPLITDPTKLAIQEAKNALEQFDWAMEEVARWIKVGNPNLKVSTLLDLHRKAMQGIDQYAGNFRPASVAIKGSNHVPVAGEDVARHVEEMLEYLIENWETRTATHLSSYAMWRLNWIHPFADGNGRTSRILSYMVLCGKLSQILPGTRTIPEQISENKKLYYDALESADVSYKKGKTDVLAMESLLEAYLANQLVSIHERATGSKSVPTAPVTKNEKMGILENMEKRPVLVSVLLGIIILAVSIYFS